MLQSTDDRATREAKADIAKADIAKADIARGFASMDRERQREIARKGGRAAHAKGTAHEWNSEEARAAGRKGGEAVSRDREHMSAIGREGGGARRSGSVRVIMADRRSDFEESAVL